MILIQSQVREIYMKRLIKKRYHLFLFAALSLFVTISTITPNIAQTSPNTSIPTKTEIVADKEVQVPDWTQISFDSLPPAIESGSIDFSAEILSQLDYDPSRIWQAGDLPSSFIMLGDVASAFGLEQLSLDKIAELTGIPLDLSAALGNFETIEWQSAESLVKAISGLEDVPLGEVAPLFNLFSSSGSGFDISSAMTIGRAIRIAPEISTQLLGKQLDLGQYKLSDIPGLADTPIGEYAQWGKTLISGVPNLGSVNFSSFPIPIPNIIRAIALIDVPFSNAEKATPEAAL